MPKVLIVYDSKTGNTETMALAVSKGAEQISDTEVTVKKAEQTKLDDLLAADAHNHGVANVLRANVSQTQSVNRQINQGAQETRGKSRRRIYQLGWNNHRS